MKKTTLIAIVYLIAIPCIAQSYLGLSIGTDFAQVRESIGPSSQKLWEVLEKDYSAESIFVGIRSEKSLSNSFSLVLTLSYTKKRVKAKAFMFEPIEGLKFNYFKNSISGLCHLKWGVFIGAGVSFNYISNIKSYYPNGMEEPFYYVRNNKKEFGSIFSIGIRKNIISVEAYFNKSYAPSRKNSNDLKPITSFGISAAYFIKIGKKSRFIYPFIKD